MPTSWKSKAKYNAKAYDQLTIVIPKGRKETIKEIAQSQGKSVNELVNDLLRNTSGLSEEEWRAKPETEESSS